jgi:Na+/proline symporter
MLFALHVVDYGVMGLYLAAVLAIGAYFRFEQRSSKDFFLAGRAMGWFPIGLSVMATQVSALSYTGIPGEAYYVGWKFLALPLAVWLILPIVVGAVLPLYRRLEIYSVYEYLELRFDAAVRWTGSGLFVVWRLLWLGGVLYAPCKVLATSAGLEIPLWLLLIVLGAVSTGYTYLGGIKAVIWTDVVQAVVMLGGLLLIVGAVWWSLPGGPAQVWQTATELDRGRFAQWTFDVADPWCVWGILPHFVLAMLSFCVADQITAQRFLTARDLRSARRSYVLNCISVSVMIPGLTYVGLCLLAFYQTHPQSMRPIWVANVDGITRRSVTDPATRTSPLIDPRTGRPQTLLGTGDILMDPTSGTPLLDWDEDRLDASTIEALIAQQRVLRPNTKEPFADAAGLVDADSGQLRIDRLAMRRGDEIVLHQRAQDELLPRFITGQLPMGVAGLVLAALLAASMSSVDSGLEFGLHADDRRLPSPPGLGPPVARGAPQQAAGGIGRSGRVVSEPPVGVGPGRCGDPVFPSGLVDRRPVRHHDRGGQHLRRSAAGRVPAGNLHAPHDGPGRLGVVVGGNRGDRLDDGLQHLRRLGLAVAVRDAFGESLDAGAERGGHAGDRVRAEFPAGPAEIERPVARAGRRLRETRTPRSNRRPALEAQRESRSAEPPAARLIALRKPRARQACGLSEDPTVQYACAGVPDGDSDWESTAMADTPPAYDVFLCHNSADKPVVRELRNALKERRIITWFDEDQLIPGRPWQEALEQAIRSIAAAAVCVGPSGFGPWQNQEMRAYIQQFVNRGAQR